MMNQMIVLTLGQQVAPRPERAARITIAAGYGVKVMRNPGEKDEHQLRRADFSYSREPGFSAHGKHLKMVLQIK
jgi:hypothetical protein